MKKWINKILIFLLVFLTIVDLFIFAYLYKFYGFVEIQKIKNFLSISKDFIIYDNYEYSLLKNGKIIEFPGDTKIPSYKTALIKLVPEDHLQIDKKERVYYIPVRVHGIKNRVNFKLLIGSLKRPTSIRLSKNGFVYNDDKWISDNINNFSKYIKKEVPIIVEVLYQNDVRFFKDLEFCNKECKIEHDKISSYAENLDVIKDKINGSIDYSNNFFIGPVTSLIIYVN